MSSFWLILKQQWTIKISSPLFSIFSLAAILVGSRDHRTQIWKGAIQGPFHQSLVQIGPLASEELIKMWKVNGRTDGRRTTDDGRSVVTIPHMTLWVRWAKKWFQKEFSQNILRTPVWQKKYSVPLTTIFFVSDFSSHPQRGVLVTAYTSLCDQVC